MTSHCEKIESIDFAASKPDEIRAWISKVEEEDRKRRTTRPLPTRDIHGGRHRQDEEELQAAIQKKRAMLFEGVNMAVRFTSRLSRGVPHAFAPGPPSVPYEDR